MFSPRPLKWPITATSLLIFFIPLLLPTATLATTNTRAKPVVMPFAFDYGNGGYGGWYSIPVTIGVGGAQVNLSISTSLSQSWIIGASICDNDTNKTACLLSRGGVYDPVKSPSWTALDSAKKDVKMTSELESGVYADIKVEVDATKDVLGLKGAGTIGIDKVALKSNTGLFELEKQRIGVFESEAPASNGVLSLQQMALGLYAAGNTASPTVHVLTGGASESYADYRTTPDLSYGDYMLIFGGYDRSIIDLNLTQQYPIHMTNLKGQKKRDEVPLPPSEATGYRLQLEIDRLIYRWTRGEL